MRRTLSSMRRKALVVAICVVPSLLVSASAHAGSPLQRGRKFRPKPLSRPLYGTKPPAENPDVQRHYVEGIDGVDLYVETWLPAPLAGRKLPKKIPTILIMTPYVTQDQERYPANETLPSFIEYMTQRGYAVAQHHVRGTGESGGCLEQTAQKQISDGARVIQYLGRDAPWSNGRVGMFGHSYDAETQISTAGFGNRTKTRYLKAMVPSASVGSQYDWNFMDGVNWTGQPLVGNASYLAESGMPGDTVAPQHYPEKIECQIEIMLNSANFTGDYTEYWQEREYRPGAPRIRAPTLYVHGLRDFNVQPITVAGWFNRLPRTTPHKGVFGVWYHAFPGRHPNLEPTWTRADWLAMVTAWYDRYLKRLPTRVGRWPQVQVQSSNGQWWIAKEFPTTGGRIGQLALGSRRKLGIRRPKGSTSYVEQLEIGEATDEQQAVFRTRPVRRRLHITGQPVLDVWLKTDRPDGHVAVELEVLNRRGQPMMHKGPNEEAVATYGVRSLQHLAPMRRGWFEQEEGKEPPTDKPIRTTVRFLPTDLLVPRGGRLRLTVSGSVSYSKGDSQPSGSASEITLLHSCRHPSALRFLMPPKRSRLLNVRELEEPRLSSRPGRVRKRDGGIARRRVCGKRPRTNRFLTGNFR